MQVGPKKTKRTFKTAKPYKKKQRTDSNALQVCTVKGSCPVPDVYNCQFTYGGYDPISMSSIGNYTGQYIYAANSLYDPLQSGGGNQPYYYDQLVAPSSGDSGLFKAWKVSASKIELELCAAGSNTVPVYCWLLPISSDDSTLPTFPPNLDEYPRAKRCTLTPGGGSQTAQKMSNYLPIYIHESITWNDWNSTISNIKEVSVRALRRFPIGTSSASLLMVLLRLRFFMRAKLTYYTELSERNQEIDYS